MLKLRGETESTFSTVFNTGTLEYKSILHVKVYLCKFVDCVEFVVLRLGQHA